MAGYPTDTLDKALARRASSSAARPIWQEWMSRHDTVPGFALQAPEVIQGFTGSWAAQYVLGSSQKTVEVPVTPAVVQRQGTHLGQPGMAEINFRPYDWGTTRHGKHGPALLGHPISFEVVGPTLKSPHMLHQWVLNPAGAQDILTLDACTHRSTVGVNEALPVGIDTIPEIYNLAALPESGLYLVVSLTGAPGTLSAGGTGGLGDGSIGDGPILAPVRAAISTPNSGTGQKAKFEIFRVTAITATTIILDGAKRLADFFTITPATTPIIRAVTLIKPVAARVVAVPGSGSPGREQVFALVPPERSLNSDLMPPLATWQGAAFDPWLGYTASVTPGTVGDYAQANALPVPKVLRQGSGHLQGALGDAVSNLAPGVLRVYLDAGVTFSAAADLGKIIHIRSINRVEDATWALASTDGGNRIGDPEMDRLLGYWEIVSAGVLGQNYYELRMVAQVDPLTGVPFFGSTEYMRMSTVGVTPFKQVQFQWTLHEPISSLWTATYLQPDKLDSARLTHLIDPEWVKTTGKNIDLADAEGSPARPDKAVFGTDGGDPGSLMDLGFRMVLFPAMRSVVDVTKLIPDFSRPITSNEVVLDATLPSTEEQFIEMDYAAGLITLSHAPNPTGGCQLVPTVGILTNPDNPRGEVVFFASFVPFSQEPGQRSPAPRVTGSQSVSGSGSACAGTESADMYGLRLHWPLEPGQTITAGQGQEIKLDVLLTPLDLPPTGFVEVVAGYDVPVGSPAWLDSAAHRVSTWGYSSVLYNDAGKTTLLGCFGGGIALDAVTTSLAAPCTAVLRRDLMLPNRGDGSVGTDFQFDTTYGHNKRPKALRFKYGTMTPEADGSVTMDTRDPLTVSHAALFSELFSSWVISGGVMPTALPLVGATLDFTELVVLIQGVRTVMPGQPLTVPVVGPSPGYVYIDSTVPSCPVYATSVALPLPTAHDVLIGMYEYVGANVTTWTDLRQPLTDSDKRLDITVGQPTGFDQPADAHFLTLADAVAYARETMKPLSGDAGRSRRIKVIGPTLEDNAKLPIRPAMSGLIIEGAARRADGTEPAPTEVTWTGDTAPALFDLSGCSSITIRDMAFRYIFDTAASAVPADRCLFTVTDAALTDAVFENIRLHGPAHGFFHCVGVGSSWGSLILRNCWAVELTDFGLHTDAAVVGEGLQAENCLFSLRAPSGAGPLFPELPLGYGSIQGLNINSNRWTIQDCFLAGGYLGIQIGGSQANILRTQVFATDVTAIDLRGSRSLVESSSVLSCHTAPAGVVVGAPGRVGIFIGDDNSKVSSTSVALIANPASANDYAFWMDLATSRVTLAHNQFAAKVQVGLNSMVEGNSITDYLNLAAGSSAAYNVVTAVLGTGDVQAGGNCKLTGNEVDGNFNVVNDGAATYCNLTDNWFKGGAGTSYIAANCTSTGNRFDDGDVFFGQDCLFTACRFTAGINATNGTGTIFQGCRFDFGASVTLLVTQVQFLGCKFLTTGAIWIVVLDGTQNIVAGCELSVTLHIKETAIAVAQDNTKVIGNTWRTAPAAGLYVDGDYLVISDNIIPGVEQVAATSYSIYVTGDYNIISGNRCGSGLRLSQRAVGTNLVSGNHVQGLYSWFSADTTFTGNILAGALEMAAGSTDCLVEGNHFDGALNLLGPNMEFIGNFLTSTLIAGASDQHFKNNDVAGAVTVGGVAPGFTQDFVGNFFRSTFSAAGATSYLAYSKIAANTFMVAVDLHIGGLVSLASSVVQGNYFWGDLDLGYATSCVVTGNFMANGCDFTSGSVLTVQGNHLQSDLLAVGCLNSEFTGNHIGGNLTATTATDSVFQGNKVTGNMTMTSSSGSTVGGNRVTGNLVLSSATGCIIQGNRVTGNGDLTGSTGAVLNGNYIGGTLNLTGVDEYVLSGNRVIGAVTVDDGAGAANTGVIVGNRVASVSAGLVRPTNNLVALGNKVNNGVGILDSGVLPVVTNISNNITD